LRKRAKRRDPKSHSQEGENIIEKLKSLKIKRTENKRRHKLISILHELKHFRLNISVEKLLTN
jgi:hypothetical protein